ncbi:MAG TPA: hypothetical protein VIH24_07160 [Candidatus Limnocylindria bacterium]|jgi:hypothetical protein
MDLSKLSSSERMAVFASAVVVITGILSLVWNWGSLMLIAAIAGAVVLGGILLPQLSPSTNLPAPKGLVMLAGGIVAALAFIITAFDWLGWIGDHLATFDTIQFLVGLVASLVMAWAGWRAYQESGHVGSAAPPSGGST